MARPNPGTSDGPAAGPEAPGSLAPSVVRGISLAGGGYAVMQAITFATYLALAKLAKPSDFGHFAAATVVLGIGLVVGESGLLAALIQRREELDEALNSALLATLFAGLGLAVLALAVAPLVGLFFHSHTVGLVAAAMSGSMLLRMLVIVPDAWLQRRFSFFRRVIVDPLGAGAFAVGSVLAAAKGLGVWALVIGTYAQLTVNLLAAWALARWRPTPRLATVRVWRELARFGRPVFTAELLRRAVQEIPVVALGRVSGAGALGQFTYGWRVASQPVNATTNVGGYVLLPAFARLSGHDERFRAAILRALRWSCAVSFPAGLMLVPLGTPAVVLVFGERWRPAGQAAMALGVLCAVQCLDSIASEAWKAYGRPDMLPRLHGLSAALTALFVGAFVTFGLVGVCIGWSLSAVAVAIYAVRGMGRIVGIRGSRLMDEIWPSAVAAVAMAAGLFCLEHFVVHADRHGVALGLVLLAAEAALGMLAYVGFLAVASPSAAHELVEALRGIMHRSSGR